MIKQDFSEMINRPVGPKLNAKPISKNGADWDMYLLPEHDCMSRDVIFIRRPSFFQRVKAWLHW